MSLNPGDSLPATKFSIQIDGIQVAWFSQISGLSKSVDVIKHVQNNPQGTAKISMLAGITQGGQVTLTRGSDMNSDFKTWLEDGVSGNMAVARKNISVIYMDTMSNPVKRFNLTNAWCCEHKYGDLEAGSSSPLNETVTITYEDIKEVSG